MKVSLPRSATLVLAGIEIAVALFSLLAVIMAVASLFRDPTHPHDGEWMPLLLIVFLPVGLVFGAAGVTLVTSWRFRWWFQFVPVLAILAVVVFLVFADWVPAACDCI